MDAERTTVSVLVIALVLLGGYMYFTVSAKNVQFIDLKVKTGSIVLSPIPSPEMPLFAHSIESAKGFNSVTVAGRAKANVNIDSSDIWIAARTTFGGYTHYKCDTCNRRWFTESHSYPPTGYLLIKNLGGMRAGDVRDFSFTLTREQIQSYLVSITENSEDKEGDVDYSGTVYVAVVSTHGLGTRRGTTYGFDVVTNPSAITKLREIKAFEWNFKVHKHHYGWYESIFVPEDGPDWPMSHEVIPAQSAEVSLKVSNSAAVLTLSLIALTVALLSLGIMKWDDVNLWVKIILFIIAVALILLIPRLIGA